MKSNLVQQGRWLVALSAAAMVVCGSGRSFSQTSIWSEDFESPIAQDNWYSDFGVWAMGATTRGPGSAHGGSKCAAAGLTGTPAAYSNSRLIGPHVVVPSSSDNPRLRFWQWYNVQSYGSFAQVEIKVGAGAWTAISPSYNGTSNGKWTRPYLDLKAYAGMNVQFAFHYSSGDAPSTGWFIDDLSLEIGPAPVFNNPELFETGWGDWYTDFGTWEIGRPTRGPGTAHSGGNCAVTGLAGTPVAYLDSRLVSPPIVIPAVSENPRLRFWHWYDVQSYGSLAQVDIKVGTAAWAAISPSYNGTSNGKWTRPYLDLKAYAGKTVQFAFHYNSGDGPSTGWFVDEVNVEVGPPPVFNNPELFEGGWGDWYTDFGTWEIGTPSPGAAHQGVKCAAAGMTGAPVAYVDSRLISPPVLVPAASENPRLRFWHWYDVQSYGSLAQVDIRVGTGAWTAISPSYNGTSNGKWTRPHLDLKAYAGKTVQFALHYSSGDGPSRGWFIDEFNLEVGPPPVFNNPELFEGGWGDWYTDFGTWEIGKPTKGPGTAHEGTNCVAAGLTGTPVAYLDSRLVSPPILVPSASRNPRLRFWHWYDVQSYGSLAQVDIRVGTGAWTSISPSYNGTSSGTWTRAYLDLASYAGRTVQFGFHYSSGDGPSAGWFIDEVLVQTDAYAPSITSGPTNQTVIVGRPAQFQVIADGSAPLSYRWRLNGVDLSSDGRISGADRSVLAISSALSSDAGEYTVVVNNSVGAVTSSPPAILTVLRPPEVTTPPADKTVVAGEDATFVVVAEGTPTLRYQWQFNGADMLGKTESSVTLYNVTPVQSGVYTVVISNPVGTNSASARLSVLQLPPPWTNHDVGDVGAAGSAVYSNGVFTVKGSGEDVERTADAFQFVHQSLIGDGQIVAQLTSVEGSDPGAEAGLMLRENLSSGAKMAFLAVAHGGEVNFRRRLVPEAYTWQNAMRGTNCCWLRLMRMGSTIVAHYSTNNVNWDLVWFSTVNLPNQVEVGLTVTAHKNGDLATATFANVNVSNLTPLPGAGPVESPQMYCGSEPTGLPGILYAGGFKMLVTGGVAERYQVYQSSDLRNWTGMGFLTNTYGVLPFLDTSATNASGNQYFRLRLAPQ